MYIQLVFKSTNVNIAFASARFYDGAGNDIPWSHLNIVSNQFTTRDSAANEDLWYTTILGSGATPCGTTYNPCSITLNLPVSSISKIEITSWGNTTYGFTSVDIASSSDNITYTYAGTINPGVKTIGTTYTYTSLITSRTPSITYKFTNCLAVGRYGPTQSQIDSAYATDPVLTGNVTSSSGIQLWTVPYTGWYTILTKGAQGATNTSNVVGGLGAIVTGDFYLTSGTVLKILVGQIGVKSPSARSASGGGGTFVTKLDNTPLIVAGGGGGCGGNGSYLGLYASISTSGTLDSRGYGIKADNGLGGSTGANSTSGGGGGGGLLGDGGAKKSNTGYPGLAFVNGGTGGSSRDGHSFGGFGGGGGNHESSGGGGAGGGYSGGCGGEYVGSVYGGGGGGGSYSSASNSLFSVGNSGNGSVYITLYATLSTADLTSTAYVRQHNDLTSSVTARKSDFVDLISSFVARECTSLLSIAKTRLTKTNDISSQSIIRHTTITDIDSTAQLTCCNDLESLASIPFNNLLDIDYLVNAIETYNDLDSFAQISWFKDLISYATIRNTAFNDLDSTAILYRIKDLLSFGYKPYTCDIDSKVAVNEQNLLSILFNVVQAPINTLVCGDIQDAYVREARPTLNYGTAQSLIAGSMVEGAYESLLKFDTTPYNSKHINNDIRVLSADLVLYLIGAYDSSAIIDVYEVSTNWTETNVTWSNLVQPTKLITSFSCTTSPVRIDLLDYLNNRQASGYNNINILLKVRNASNGQTFYFESRESTTTSHRPQIEVKYQDSSWTGYTNNTNLNSTATIKALNSKDLTSFSTIRQHGDVDIDSKGTVQITEYEELSSTSTIRHTEVIDIPSTGVMLPSINLTSYATIRHTETLDINSASILYQKLDLDGTAEITTFYEWLDAHATIRRNEPFDLNSIVDVWHKLLLESKATVRHSDLTDLPSKATTRLTTVYDLDSTVFVRQHNDLDSKAKIELSEYKDLSSKGTSRLTNDSDLDSVAFVKQYLELNSKADVRHGGYKDLLSFGNVRVPTTFDLDGSVIVNQHIDLTSTAKARLTDTTDISSTSKVRLSADTDLNSLGTINPNFYLSSTAKIQRTNTKDIDMYATINNVADLDSNATIVALVKSDISDLDSSATIYHDVDLTSQVLILQHKDLLSNAFIMHNADIPSHATLVYSKDLSSLAKVRLTKTADIDSTVTIRQYDIFELNSFAYSMGAEMIQLNSFATVCRHGVDYLDCSATVHTTARRWVPNIHGADVFNYEDRKLPRVWKRENFIP